MIILFRGTGEGKHMSSEVLSIYAAINAIKYNRRTLVLQLTNNAPVEAVLTGKADAEVELNHGQYKYSDKGIDTLLRKIETKSFDENTFDLACKSMLKAEHLLDVATVSNKKDFEQETIQKKVLLGRLVKRAKATYDDVYLLGNGKNPEQMEILNMLADTAIICIGQGSKENIPEIDTAKGNHLLLVTEYDSRSSYDVARIKKIYGEKQIAILPYNTAFKDAYNSDDVLSFAISNTDVKEHDSNFEFFSKIYDVEKKIMNNEVPEEPKFDFNRLKQAEVKKETPELKTLTSGNVRYTKKYKGFLFWKKEIDGYEVDLDDFSDEEELGSDPVKEKAEPAEKPEAEAETEEDFTGDFEVTFSEEDETPAEEALSEDNDADLEEFSEDEFYGEADDDIQEAGADFDFDFGNEEEPGEALPAKEEKKEKSKKFSFFKKKKG